MLTEFGFLENLKRSRKFSRIGDDCAVLPKDDRNDLIVTSDLLVEDIDFKLAWCTPEDIGHKSLAVSLSDIAAMGGRPDWALISIAVPAMLWNLDFVDRFYDGLCALADRFGVEIAGGDVSRSPDKFVVDSTVAGSVPAGRAILRSGARPGDAVWVSGTLGGAAWELKRLLDGDAVEATRLLRPEPRIDLARTLMDSGWATAMIDLSDGLSGDLSHLCRSSSVGAVIDRAAIPIDGRAASEPDPEHALSFAIDGGEDFELLFTAPDENFPPSLSGLVTRLGTITANEGIIKLRSASEERVMTPRSFSHF